MSLALKRLLRLAGVVDKTGLSRAMIYKLMKENDFPESVKISKRCVSWVESEIEEWMENKLEMTNGNNDEV